jgi:SAM-dependent methyltransferase
MTDFYDKLAPLYHLIHQDWGASVRRQGEQLGAIAQREWGAHRKVLDVSCGIGTQAIALALRGYSVTGSDLSPDAIARARREAAAWGVNIAFSVCDMRQAHLHHGCGFDIVVSGDNSLPHLLTDEDILIALKEMLACLSIGGGCIITVREYDGEERGRNLVKSYGARTENGKRYLLFQVWDFAGEHYDLTFFIVEEDVLTGDVNTRVARSRYYALSTVRLCELMRNAGFQNVRRIDGAFYQPVLVGTKTA